MEQRDGNVNVNLGKASGEKAVLEAQAEAKEQHNAVFIHNVTVLSYFQARLA